MEPQDPVERDMTACVPVRGRQYLAGVTCTKDAKPYVCALVKSPVITMRHRDERHDAATNWKSMNIIGFILGLSSVTVSADLDDASKMSRTLRASPYSTAAMPV